jgi:hypothetical protein
MSGLALYEHWMREGGDKDHQAKVDDLLYPDQLDDDGVDMSRIDPATGEPVGWSEGASVR